MKNNPYIERITTISEIVQNEDIFSKKGKWNAYFYNSFPIHLEIWTGWGGFFADQCAKRPHVNHIGMEIKYKRLFKTREKAYQAGNNNFIILKAFGQQIGEIFDSSELTQTSILFPDPWHNKKHRKKHKLIQTDFLEKLFTCTKIWGLVHVKTDHAEYFREMLDAFMSTDWENIFTSHDFEYIPEIQAKRTEFEQLFRQKSLPIHYAIFQKPSGDEKIVDIRDFFV